MTDPSLLAASGEPAVAAAISAPVAPSVEFEALPATCASIELNGISCVRSLLVKSPHRLAGVRLRLNIECPDPPGNIWERALEGIPAGGSLAVDAKSFAIPVPLLRRSTEREPVDLVAHLLASDGSVLATARHRLTIVPATHWFGVGHACESLAAFVTPNAAAVHELLRDASARLAQTTGQGALDGYLRGEPSRAQHIMEACYEAVAARNITYAVLQPSFERTGQKVRSPAELLGDRLGNCLDMSVTLAAVLEAAGLNGFLVIGDGHALVGAAIVDESFSDSVHEGPSRLLNRLDLGEVRLIEATTACGATGSFAAALEAGEKFLRGASDQIHVVDITASRRAGIHPLPERIQQSEGQPPTVEREPVKEPWKVRQPKDLPPLPPAKRLPHEARIEHWKRKLLDLTLRNSLLNDRRSAGIPLAVKGEDALAHLEDNLWDERAFRLVAGSSGQVLSDQAAREELDRKWLRSALPEVELFKRATKVFRDARSSLEETGARSLYLAIGFLEYRAPQRDVTVRAPILLVPVEMERISRSEGFRVRAVTDDPVPNVALLEFLRAAYSLDLGIGGSIPQDDRGIHVGELLDRVRRAVRDVPGFVVHSEAKLANYSFKKLPLFEEMRARSKELGEHLVVRALLDRDVPFGLRKDGLVESGSVEGEHPLGSMWLPLPADSSQVAAILSATRGSTFVLQGPPGTGKSQTITNLLADCLGRGLRVLFIAEKGAALKVVSERLRKAGLGVHVLDLHADHATKTRFVEQIQESLRHLEQRASTGAGKFNHLGQELNRCAARLRNSCEALHGPAGEQAIVITPYAAAERAVAARLGLDAMPLQLDDALPTRPTYADLDLRREAARTLGATAAELPATAAHELSDFTPRQVLSREAAEETARAAAVAATALQQLAGEAERLAQVLGCPPPRTLQELRSLLDFSLLLSEPAPGAATFAAEALAPDAHSRLESIAQAAQSVQQADDATAKIHSRYARGVLSLDAVAQAGDLRAARDRFFITRWMAVRRARGVLRRLAKSPPARNLGALLKEFEAIAATRDSVEEAIPLRATLVPFTQPGGGYDWTAINAGLERMRKVATVVPALLGTSRIQVAEQTPRAIAASTLAPAAQSTRNSLVAAEDALGLVAAFVQPDPDLAVPTATLEEIRARLTRLAGSGALIEPWSRFTTARTQAAACGLRPLADQLAVGTLRPADAERAAEHAMLLGWLRRRLREDVALADCTQGRAAEARIEFERAMEHYRKWAGDAAVHEASQRARRDVASASTDRRMAEAMRIVQPLLAVSTIRRPIRRVMLEGAPVIAVLKPIVLASPLSAATLLPPELPDFDLVVFDEASQVPVWDAACALSRGKAAVIVGDSKQLPPTNFFERKDQGVDESGEGDPAAGLEPLESVLDEAIASGFPQSSLLWHYRSRDERLIEFSNRRSYGGRLKTFPAALRADSNLGVEFRHVAGIYDRGRTKTNRVEAEAVVAEIVRRLRDPNACTANRSIGVVTFSEAQQSLVQDLLDEEVDRDALLRDRMSEAEKYGEPVFIKNLENVQGDERATMLFSICYGRDETGKLYYSFGPLNLAGGERRLNVAVSRAREKVVLFSSVRASDLEVARCTSRGVQDLRDYLAFAEFGTIPALTDSSSSPREIDSSGAELALAEALRGRGWVVDAQVGRSGDYRVNLALAKPEHRDRWVLGVEFDGEFMRLTPTAMDREIVRTGVLRGLGWRMVRVSVLDFIRDPATMVARIENAACDAAAT